MVSGEKATWTRWNITAEIERRLRPLRFATPADRDAATTLVLDRVLQPDHAVQLTPNGLEPDTLLLDDADAVDPTYARRRRANGESVLVEHGAARYATQDLLDAEQRLLDHATTPTSYGLPTHEALSRLDAFEQRYGVTLDPGQRTLTLSFTTRPSGSSPASDRPGQARPPP